MTKIIDIVASFNKATVCLRGHQDKWMSMLAWKSAIKRFKEKQVITSYDV
jgi:hypothetical protein